MRILQVVLVLFSSFLSVAGAASEPLPFGTVSVLITLDSPPARVADLTGNRLAKLSVRQAEIAVEQQHFLASARAAGIALDLGHRPKSTGRVLDRMTYLSNAIVARVHTGDLAKIQSTPGVRQVEILQSHRLMLNNSVDYILGDSFDFVDRRLAVYGANEELTAVGPGNAPAATAMDGLEGQGMHLGIIDSGLDYEHPMLGGSGVGATPTPQIPPNVASPTDNRKVIYFNKLDGATTDDFGHGTHVGTTAGGYRVDGNTPGVLMVGGMAGPTPGGVVIHGVAPAAEVLGFAVCNAGGTCTGDVELAVEDAVSPFFLIGPLGNSMPTAVAKPVADVVNMSLGATGGGAASASSRTVNNAMLAGLTVVAAAGNDGPDASTLGAPCVATGAICVAAILDPGSTTGADVLQAAAIIGDDCAGTDGSSGECPVSAGPSPETGTDSTANPTEPGERIGMRAFVMGGSGPLPENSVSAHYVFVDRDQLDVPATVTNRIAVLKGGTGAFAAIVNPVAAQMPAAILLVSETTSATAVASVGDVPLYTFLPDDGEYLLDLLSSTDDDAVDPLHGAVSELPLRLNASINPDAFTGDVSTFSSRGPNNNPDADYRTIKPDVAAPGSAVLAATTTSGNPDNALGMANPTGYTTTNGTSMATPHVAGAATLLRQHLRTLGYDATDFNDEDYDQRRYEANILTRALLTNTATDLRTGRGGDDPAGINPPYTIHDIGAGLINVAAAIDADAVMTSPTTLFLDLDRSDAGETPEFDSPGFGDSLVPPTDTDGNALIDLPTASFGNQPLIGIEGNVSRSREVNIRDITGFGGGTWTLQATPDTNMDGAEIAISFTDMDGNPLTSVDVPTDGVGSYQVRATVDGRFGVDGRIYTWYVLATQQGSGKTLRMPFLLRTVKADLPSVEAPIVTGFANTEGTDDVADCPLDTDGAFEIEFAYTAPDGSPAPIGFVVQRGTMQSELFADDTSETLVAGANSRWSGAATWQTMTNPHSGDSNSYFVPDLVEQDDSLTMVAPVAFADGVGGSLTITTSIHTEPDFDFAHVEASGDGGPFESLGRFSGEFDGELGFDLSAFAGQDVTIRFRMTSDMLVPAEGWYIDDIRIDGDDLADIGTVEGNVTSAPEMVDSGSYLYRVAGLFPVEGSALMFRGPVSNTECMTVDVVTPIDDEIFADGFEVIPLQQ